ncbi:MAG TPA: cation diffusion facilitator family transporter [Xanthobacteraceae bacterium]|nr:cation diffusion facilitator family transporter [Xanthobacteraceae bacterium]
MQDIKERVALTSMAASGGLTVAKAIVGVMSGSLAILSEAGHSFIDFIATVMTYFAVRISGKPADAEHHYGHGKVESISALAETALLFVLSGVVIWEAMRRLLLHEDHAVEATLAAFTVIIASVFVDFFRGRALYKVAKETSSEALEADALHFSSDMYSSLAVLAGLGGVALGLPWADAAAAVVVAVFVCLAGWRLGRRTIETLTDTAPAGAAEAISAAATAIPGVVSVERVRARPVGNKLFVDLGVTVSRTLPLDRVTELKDNIIHSVREALPSAEVVLTADPRALDSETIIERVMVIARNQALAVHHVTVHSIAGKLAVAVDLEVKGQLTLGDAHEIASGLEDAVCRELGPGVEVETHIEPMEIDGLAGRDASASRISEVQAMLTQIAAETGAIRDIHEVRVRETDSGEIVNFHCHADAELTVQAVHENVDAVERALRQRMPEIKRVVGHAEPKG